MSEVGWSPGFWPPDTGSGRWERSLRKLSGRTWGTHPNLEFAKADLQNKNLTSLSEAIKDCFAAYYLVHSMDPEYKDFCKG